MVEELAEAQSKPRIEAKFRKPTLNDGQSLWRMARDSQVLDLNSSYSYLLWSRDFSDTSVMATVDGEPAGFITGYMRPGEPNTLMVWQVAVDHEFRGRKLAAEMLDRLATQVRAERVETTITADNEASIRLFAGFASRREAPMEREPLFTAELYPDGHDTEYLYRIGPLT
ncbi:diaminobutyrate acetyltransferase [Arthrobacter sulfonylureivorans]|uniref:diaminobutyrate acetyltransferase n=1 Tax=Arthrobacter sulfonylureivorans TaxID=2486855 RepID=UPI0039E4B6AF